MTSLIRKIFFLCFFYFTAWATVGSASDNQVQDIFEKRYQEWKTWVSEHPLLSTYTTNEKYEAIVALGPPVVPLLIEKMEKNPEDFHLEIAVHRITKKRFDKGEWPEGTRGDAITAARMYVQWWKDGRFKTGARFAELHSRWKLLKSEKKDKEAQETYQQIVDLGIPVLPYLIDKVEQQSELIPAISKLSDGSLHPTAKAADCKPWWGKNKQKFELPTQSQTK